MEIEDFSDDPDAVGISILEVLCDDCGKMHYNSSLTFFKDDLSHTFFTSIYAPTFEECMRMTMLPTTLLFGDILLNDVLSFDHQGNVLESTTIDDYIMQVTATL
jgi:hypothetical protein